MRPAPPRNRHPFALALALLAAGCGSSATSPDAGRAEASASATDANTDRPALAVDGATAPANSPPDGAAPGTAGDVAAADLAPREAGPTPTPEAVCDGGLLVFPGFAEIAAHSRPLDRVIVASSYHRLLYIADPGACAARTVVLPRPALGIGVSADGARATVGLDGAIVDVDLRTGAVGTPVLVPGAPESWLTDGRQGLHFVSVPFLSSSGTTDPDRAFVSINLDTQQLKRDYRVRGRGRLVPHPTSGLAFWISGSDFDTQLFDVSAGEAVPRGRGDFGSGDEPCGHLAFSEDGRRAVTACGQVLAFTAGGNPAFTRERTLESFQRQQDRAATIDFAANRIASARWEAFSRPEGREIRLWDASDGKLLGNFPTPILEGSTSRARPLRVFLRADGQRFYTLVESGAYRETRHALAVMAQPATPSVWPKASQAPVETDDYGLIRHLGGTPALETLGPGRILPFDVRAAAFSRQRGLLAVAALKPSPAVHLLHPSTGAQRSLPLPAEAVAAAIDDASGLLAVGHRMGVTLVDLNTSMLTRELTITEVRDLSFGPPGKLWVGTGTMYSPRTSSADLATGTLASLPSVLWLRLHPDGMRAYAGGGSDVLRYSVAGDTLRQAARGNSSDLVAPVCLPVAFDVAPRLFTSCGRIIALATDGTTDLRPGGALEGWPSITHGDLVPGGDRALAIGGGLIPAPLVSSNGARELRLFRAPLWAIERRFELGEIPGLITSGAPTRAFGRYVFVDSSGHRAYVVAAPLEGGTEMNDTVLLTVDF
jgi:hypothetical protein